MFAKKWTPKEEALLAKHTLDELEVLLPGRTRSAIKSRMERLNTWGPKEWERYELEVLPSNSQIDAELLSEISERLPQRHRDEVWLKLKSRGCVWTKNSEDLYPDHGKKWTKEETDLFPTDLNVTKEILAEVTAKLPRRKPDNIWPKMKKMGYIWVPEEKPSEVKPAEETELATCIAAEIGFSRRAKTRLEPAFDAPDRRDEIAKLLELPQDFTQLELIKALQARVTVFPWEMQVTEAQVVAIREPTYDNKVVAARELIRKLEEFLSV